MRVLAAQGQRGWSGAWKEQDLLSAGPGLLRESGCEIKQPQLQRLAVCAFWNTFLLASAFML